MTPILKKSLIVSFILHVALLLGGGKGIGAIMGLILGLFGIDISHNTDQKIDIPVVDISVVEISDVTNIPMQGDNGSNAKEVEEQPQEEPAKAPEEVITKATEKEAEKVVEENIGDERAPTENVDDAGSNFTQGETTDQLAEEVMKITEEEVDKPKEDKEEPPKEEEKPKSEYKWDVPISDIVIKNRPSDLKNLANREEAAPQAQSQGENQTSDNAGDMGENLDDILGQELANSTSGEATATLISAIKGQLGACYAPPISYPTGRDYTILIRAVFSANGRIISSQYAPGYNPLDDIERARADAALRATRDSNCNQINLPNGQIEEGYTIDLPFK
ncbi:MAG: hypothetical protein ACK5MJ_08290 [Alphaproteobacteria bacterium]